MAASVFPLRIETCGFWKLWLQGWDSLTPRASNWICIFFLGHWCQPGSWPLAFCPPNPEEQLLERTLWARAASWRPGRCSARQGRAGGSPEGSHILFVELGTCFLSECPAWTPRLQGKAAWFPVSSQAWKHYWRKAIIFFYLGKKWGFALSCPRGIPKFRDQIFAYSFLPS